MPERAVVAPVLYDHRESKSGVPAALERAGVPVAPAQLPVGDYVLSDRLIVERKTGGDLAASIKDRRLFEQTARLVEAYPAVVVIVEGEPIHIGEASWMGALGRVVLAGVSVLGTSDPHDTAEWLVRLYHLERKGPGSARGLPRVRRPTDDLAAVAEDVLTCLPGISTVGARRLLEHFGTLAAVTAASAQDLREVRGIGPVRAASLAALFHAEYAAGIASGETA
jgi:DNA excision repair protein ERCC-4